MKVRNYVALLVGQLLFSLSLAAATPAVPAKSEAVFSNKDVIKLVKLDLGDDVVIGKIKQAADVAFDLTTDGLVQLKQAGVGSRVISAMLEKTTPPSTPNAGGENQPQFFDGREDARIVIDDKEIRLPSNRGDLSTTGFRPVVFTFLDYPGLHARTRVKNARPTLVIRSEHDPKGYYYLGMLDVNHEEDNNRSLKIEQKATGFTATTRVIPAGRWYVEYESSEKTPGMWYITPKRDLRPGEYGVVVPGGVLYEFGVD